MSASKEFTWTDFQPGIYVRTLLLIDLVDSTRLFERIGDLRTDHLNQRHDRLVRNLLTRFGGLEIDKTDGFLVLFERPIEAVQCALAYQRKLAELREEAEVDLEARVGIHLGEVFLRRNDPEDIARGAKPLEVEGLAKPLAARVMSLAQAGQILLTQNAFELSRRAMIGETAQFPPDLRWLHHGLYKLKGVAVPLQIYEVGQEGSAPLTPPPDSAKARRVRKVAFDQTGELMEIEAQPWWRRHQRWLALATLVLSLAIAVGLWWLLSRPPGGGIRPSRPSIAVLEFRNLAGGEEWEWLATALPEMLSTELAAGEEMRVVAGESIARMSRELSLASGETLAPDTLERVRRNLDTDFVVVGSFVLLGQGLEQSLRLQLRLQDTRSPEGGTALSKTGPESQLFELVSQASEDLRQHLQLRALSPDNQRVVRATLSSSKEALRLYAEGLAHLRDYDAQAAQELLRGAIEADPDFALAHTALSDAWIHLGFDEEARKSARRAYDLSENLSREDALAIQARYFETIHDWSQAVDSYRLLASRYPDNLEYGLKLAQNQVAAARMDDARATLAELRRLPSPRGEDPRIDLAEAALAYQAGDYARDLALSQEAERKGREKQAWSLVALAKRQLSWALVQLGRRQEAALALDEARDLFFQVGDQNGVANVLSATGSLRVNLGELASAEELYRQAESVYQRIGNRTRLAAVLNNLSLILFDQGRLEEAREALEQSLAITRQLNRYNIQVLALANLALVRLRQGALDDAENQVRQGLEVAERGGHHEAIAWLQQARAQIALARGQTAEAQAALDAFDKVAAALSFPALTAHLHHDRGELALLAGRLKEAGTHFEESLELRSRLNEKGRQAETELALARLRRVQGRGAEAIELAQRAEEEFRREERADGVTSAIVVRAEMLLDEGKPGEAATLLEGVRAAAKASEAPTVRLQFALADGRCQAARGQTPVAREGLRQAGREAGELGLRPLALEAELALGRIEGADGQDRVARVARAAAELGLGLLQRQAEAVNPTGPPKAGRPPSPGNTGPRHR